VRFKVRDIDISAGDLFVVILNKKDADKLNLIALDRVRIKKKKEIICVVDIYEGDKRVKDGEIGLFEEVLKEIKVKNGEIVDIVPSEKPKVLDYIKKKLEGKDLGREEINEIIKSILKNELTEIEKTYFVSGCYVHGLSLDESYYLTMAIVNNSKKLDFGKKIIVDKHSIGGVGGNRTTMIVVPILVAAGLTIPKTSTRNITSVSGTSDTMEVLAKVDFSAKEIKNIVNKIGGCMVWGGALELASADDRLIKIERPLGLDPKGIMLASIMAKKKSVGATHVIIDLPFGEGSKLKNIDEAIKLKSKFIELGRKLGIKVKIMISDGTQPVGNGVGPCLEAIDVLNVLLNKGPEDLKEKSVEMAGNIFEMLGYKKSREKALEILESGKAYETMKEIIKAQKGKIFRPEQIKLGRFKYNVKTKKKGKVKSLDNKLINKIGMILGAPRDKGAGIYFNFKKNGKVNKNDLLFILYSNSEEKLKNSLEILGKRSFINIE